MGTQNPESSTLNIIYLCLQSHSAPSLPSSCVKRQTKREAGEGGRGEEKMGQGTLMCREKAWSDAGRAKREVLRLSVKRSAPGCDPGQGPVPMLERRGGARVPRFTVGASHAGRDEGWAEVQGAEAEEGWVQRGGGGSDGGRGPGPKFARGRGGRD